jgi:hypothetical protein
MPRRTALTVRGILLAAALCANAGCGGDARVELAAADSITAIGSELARAVEEYHAEISQLDDDRERAAVRAFVDRLRHDMSDEQKTKDHEEALLTALVRVRNDRETEWKRFSASLDNVAALRETAAGLRRVAIESLSLEDETRRYFEGVLERLRSQESEVDDGQADRTARVLAQPAGVRALPKGRRKMTDG